MSIVRGLGQGANLPNRTQLIQSLNRRERAIEAEGTLEVGTGPLLQGTSRNRDDFAGRYINQQGGSRLFNTGTDERGRYVNGYVVVGQGRARIITPEYLRPASEAPRSILSPAQAKEHLELETTGRTDAQGRPIYRRDGFRGDYTVREDGTIFFSGGYHTNGGRGRINLPAQTYINGRWYRGEMPVGTSSLPPGGTTPPGNTAPPGIGIPPGNTTPPGIGIPPGSTAPPGIGIPPGSTAPPGIGIPPGGSTPPGIGIPPGAVSRVRISPPTISNLRNLRDIDRNLNRITGEIDDFQNDPAHPDMDELIDLLREVSREISQIIRNPGGVNPNQFRELATQIRTILDDSQSRDGDVIPEQMEALARIADQLEAIAG